MTASFQRLLLVSVGTSIYTSLSWTREAFPDSPLYQECVDDSKLLTHPRLRARHPDLEDTIASCLNEQNPGQIAKNLDKEKWRAQLLRYSAELTTMMNLSRLRAACAGQDVSAEGWVRQSEIVCMTDSTIQEGKSRIAGMHLIELIKQWASTGKSNFERTIVVDGTESGDAQLAARAQSKALSKARTLAKEYLDAGREVFYLASGGFKMTAFLAGLLLPPSRPGSPLYLVYQHEDSPSIIILEAERSTLPQKADGPAIHTTAKPAALYVNEPGGSTREKIADLPMLDTP